MDLILKGRGMHVTDQIRQVAEHKLAKLERLDRHVRRVEVEVTLEHNPRMGDGSHRVAVAFDVGRRTLRAEGAGHDVDSALDQVVERLERQLSTYRGKLRARLMGRRNRLQSRRTSPEDSTRSE
jgi:ribosomal subunit interface protein